MAEEGVNNPKLIVRLAPKLGHTLGVRVKPVGSQRTLKPNERPAKRQLQYKLEIKVVIPFARQATDFVESPARKQRPGLRDRILKEPQHRLKPSVTCRQQADFHGLRISEDVVAVDQQRVSSAAFISLNNGSNGAREEAVV